MATTTLKDLAVDFLTRVVAGDVRGAYERHVGAGFRHHNPYFAGDAAALQRGMEEDEARNPGKLLEVQVESQRERTYVRRDDRKGRDDRGGRDGAKGRGSAGRPAGRGRGTPKGRGTDRRPRRG